ncbi:non-specific serine/threonine protein kinase [Rhizobium leguminosarum]|uniref:Non-specific serine/threonine protein kinase n=2 Tax=Rhizobium leguminosarum TaxID=384 RepID=A0A7Z0DWW5_RHILE|nr:winged helix-turn-helix domain-containing protein [Rhizobium leguminosarum]EJB06055.1 putative ATPase [Rhizobium leguminosarum bv. trifolii WSM597]NYJ10890.1 non-specific serine/threonine protein kinase [Rhizobium leguminosarum]
MALGQVERRVFEFRGWEVDLARRELRALGSAVPIGSRAFEIIETLVQSAGELVTKDDLMQRVWPGIVVEDNTVQVHMSAIRKAFGPDRNMLKTVSGRGYRLLGDWMIRQDSSPAEPVMSERARPTEYAFRTNIPVATSALVGREVAVQEVGDLISAFRVVTLIGPGGIGKTVLATELARKLFPTLKGDVLFVELVSLSDPDLVPSTVAHILNLQLHSDGTSPELVARAVGDRRMLLILDNCEHMIDAAATMAETLVHLCPNVSVLATSRELLRIEGECAYQVPTLDVPEEGGESFDDVVSCSAVQLFIARTRSLRADFQPQGDKLAAIAAICRHLDGIPLAIEFAAARAATLGIEQVAGRLADRFVLLTGGRRTALPRHQTLRAALDWSYELLPETERRLLRHLAIFPAGFTIDAATAVMNDQESSVALGISNLISKSLVSLDGSEAAPRWRLLETVRVYAREKLAFNRECDQSIRRLAEFCLTLFAPFGTESELQVAIDDFGRYAREVDNLRAALNWAFSQDGDHALGVELAATASDFWVAMSLVAEACEWACTALDQIGEAAGTHRELVLQCNLGFALIYTQGMSQRTYEILSRALTLAREIEDFDCQQRATCGLWLFSARSGALNEALAFARDYEAVARARNLESRATAAWLVGVPQSYMAAHVEANAQLQRALEQYPPARRRRDMIRLGGDVRCSALSHNTVNLLSLGLLDTALRGAKLAVEEARLTDQPFVLCVALWSAGFASLSLGDMEAARDYGEELVDLAYKRALRPFRAAGLCLRGSLALRRGDPATGIELLRAGLADMRETVYLLFDPCFRKELAAALGATGRIDDGLTEIEETLGFATETNYLWYVPEILRTKGELLMLQGSNEPASIENLFRQAMAHANGQKALYWELSAAISLAEFLRDYRRNDEAKAVLSSVYNRFTEGFSASTVRKARALLSELP